MQAIQTKYFGPGNVRGSRIKASFQGGSVTVPYDHALDLEDNHQAAVKALTKKFGCGNIRRGAHGVLPDGTHVWIPVQVTGQLRTINDSSEATGI